MSALHRAVLAGRPTEVLHLLERRKHDPNARDKTLRTPLIACSLADKEEEAVTCAAILLGKGAQIGLSDRQGKDALCWACQNGRVKLVEMFLEDYPCQFKFDLRKPDRDGNSALHLAARAGRPDVVGLLLKSYAANDLFAEMCARNRRGETPLQVAAKLGNSAAVLALLPVASDSLLGRRGGVDFRSAPKWAKAAMKVSRSTGDWRLKHGRPRSEQPSAGSRGSPQAPGKTTGRARPETVTAGSSNPKGHPGSVIRQKPGGNAPALPRPTNISDIFRISEVQLSASSAYRRPAKAPLPPTLSVGEDETANRPRSPALKIPPKGRRGSTLSNRSRCSSRRESVPDAALADKTPTKAAAAKAVPTLVIDQPSGDVKSLPAVRLSKDGSDGRGFRRLLTAEGKEAIPTRRHAQRSSALNRSMSDIPESPVQGGSYLAPHGPGTTRDFVGSATSLHSLASDLPGLFARAVAFGRSGTDPAIGLEGSQASLVRRTKSEPSLNTLDRAIESLLVSGNSSGPRVDPKRPPPSRSKEPTSSSRRRGHAKTRAQGKDKHDSTVGGKRHFRLTPLKVETPNHGAPHAHQTGPLSSPSAPRSQTQSPRPGRRFFRSSRETESDLRRRRTDLEKRIKCVQEDIKRLDSRRRARKYKSLIPDWVTFDGDTSLEELVSAVLNDTHSADATPTSPALKQRGPCRCAVSGRASTSSTNHPKDTGRYNSASTESSRDFDPEDDPIHSRSSFDLVADIQAVGSPQRPRRLQNSLLRMSLPARPPAYKQSRSILVGQTLHALPGQQVAAYRLASGAGPATNGYGRARPGKLVEQPSGRSSRQIKPGKVPTKRNHNLLP